MTILTDQQIALAAIIDIAQDALDGHAFGVGGKMQREAAQSQIDIVKDMLTDTINRHSRPDGVTDLAVEVLEEYGFEVILKKKEKS